MSLSRKLINTSSNRKKIICIYTAISLGTSIGLLACILLNNVLNNHVMRTCNTKLNRIVTLNTVIGDSYGCVSKMVLHGPPAPLKP
jgi:hypothetical protein